MFGAASFLATPPRKKERDARRAAASPLASHPLPLGVGGPPCLLCCPPAPRTPHRALIAPRVPPRPHRGNCADSIPVLSKKERRGDGRNSVAASGNYELV